MIKSIDTSYYPENLTDESAVNPVDEVYVQGQVSSPYIVKYYNSFVDGLNLNIVMEWCSHGDLNSYLALH